MEIISRGKAAEAEKRLLEDLAKPGVLKGTGIQRIKSISGYEIVINLNNEDAFGSHKIIFKSWTEKQTQPVREKKNFLVNLFKK